MIVESEGRPFETRFSEKNFPVSDDCESERSFPIVGPFQSYLRRHTYSIRVPSLSQSCVGQHEKIRL